MRKFLGEKLREEPKQSPDDPDVFEVQTERMGVEVHREQLERHTTGRVSLVVPDLPCFRKPKTPKEGT